MFVSQNSRAAMYTRIIFKVLSKVCKNVTPNQIVCPLITLIEIKFYSGDNLFFDGRKTVNEETLPGWTTAHFPNWENLTQNMIDIWLIEW